MHPQRESEFTILLVENDLVLLHTQAQLVTELGYSVLRAENAYHALALLSEHVINCVITDIQLPYLCGNELAFLIYLRHPNMPIIALKDDITYSDVKNIGILHFNKIVQKPLTKPLLKKILAECLP